jgi:hypothetical protein
MCDIISAKMRDGSHQFEAPVGHLSLEIDFRAKLWM